MKTAFIKPAPEGEASLPSLYTCIPKPVIPAWMPESRRRDVKVRRHPAAKIDAPKLASMRGVTLIELTVVLLVLVALAGLTLPMYTNTPRYAQCVATDATMANIRDAIMGSGGMGGYRSDMGVWPNSDSSTASSLNDLFNNPLYDTPSVNSNPFNQSFNPPATTNSQTQSFNPTTQRGWRGPYISGGMTCAKISSTLSTSQTPFPCNLPGTSAYTVALDSFPVIATDSSGNTSIALQGSPIVLMQDATSSGSAYGKYFLISGGQNSVIDASSTTVETSRKDDRVLYLDAPDPAGGNPSCS